MNGDYINMRLVKSEEELDWFRIGAALSDLSIDALERELRPGLTEHEVADLIERAYVPWGGRTVIHFIGSTPMKNPFLQVPAQFTSSRTVQSGDILVAEISASFREYSGQILRSFAVDSEPTPLYLKLHSVAEAAFNEILKAIRPGASASDLVQAGKVIENSGFTICDDMIHGYGGGYLPPVLGLPSRRKEVIPDLSLEVGMMLVIQPNVITPDKKSGVQTGECVVVTKNGCESLHNAKRGFLSTGRKS